MTQFIEVVLFVLHWLASLALFATAILRMRVLTLRDKSTWEPLKLTLCAGWVLVAIAAAGGIYAPILRGMREAGGANVEVWINPRLTVTETTIFVGFALVFVARGLYDVKAEKAAEKAQQQAEKIAQEKAAQKQASTTKAAAKNPVAKAVNKAAATKKAANTRSTAAQKKAGKNV